MPKVTKEIIIDTALELYSVHGYEATSMSDLATALGIKAPTLYFHFKNKQALFDTIIETVRDYFWKSYPSIHAPVPTEAEEAKLYAENIELAQEGAVKSFLFYYKDKYASTFRRLLSIERYRNPQMDAVYRELYMDAPVDNQTELIAELIRQGYMEENVAPHTAAIELYAPMLFLIGKYDCMPDKEAEAIEAIKSHVAQFMRKYLKHTGGCTL